MRDAFGVERLSKAISPKQEKVLLRIIAGDKNPTRTSKGGRATSILTRDNRGLQDHRNVLASRSRNPIISAERPTKAAKKRGMNDVDYAIATNDHSAKVSRANRYLP
jgi:hypothetical protein